MQWPTLATALFLAALIPGLSTATPTTGAGSLAAICRIGPGPLLPQAYLDLARRDRAFKWIARLKSDAQEVQGPGWERIEGSGMRDNFSFVRVDLDGDGVCDWYLTSSAPQSTGGDRSSFNTLYVWRSGRWKRLGADLPAGKPDVLGLGRTDAQRAAWQFGDQLAVLRDEASAQTWFISWHENRNEARAEGAGYRLLLWDSSRQGLAVQDKWKSGSAAAQVYAAFKARGAWGVGNTLQVVQFEPDVEADERQALCLQRSLELAPHTAGKTLPHRPDPACSR